MFDSSLSILFKRGIKYNKYLKTIDISYNNITNIDDISYILKYNIIENINLKNNNIYNKYIKNFTYSLMNNISLKTLILSDNKDIDDEGICYIANAIIHQSKIRNETLGVGDHETPGVGDHETPGGDDEAQGVGDHETPGGGDHETQGGDHETMGGDDHETLGVGDHETMHEAQGVNDEAQGSKDEAQGGSDEAEGSKDEAQGGSDEAQGGSDEAQGSNNEAQGGNDEAQGGSDEAEGSKDEAQGGSDEAQGSKYEAQGGSDEECERFKKPSNHVGLSRLDLSGLKFGDKGMIAISSAVEVANSGIMLLDTSGSLATENAAAIARVALNKRNYRANTSVNKSKNIFDEIFSINLSKEVWNDIETPISKNTSPSLYWHGIPPQSISLDCEEDFEEEECANLAEIISLATPRASIDEYYASRSSSFETAVTQLDPQGGHHDDCQDPVGGWIYGEQPTIELTASGKMTRRRPSFLAGWGMMKDNTVIRSKVDASPD
eukprot:GHVL01025573.1.p1 GENE.GHVL01025573.1~~GHVL01025573.1.p1  ORF type:complete len:493 (-),score=209.24 GHVL01025573.1:201-1679(-)